MAAQPDTGDFDAWYSAIRPKLLALIGGSNISIETREEVVDEALARAFERWDEVSEMANRDGWAYVVARNTLRSLLQRESLAEKVRRMRTRDEVKELPDDVVDFHMMLEPLTPTQRHVMVLRHVFGMTEPEIGEVLGIKRGTVSSRIHRSHAKLRSTLPLLVAMWGLR